MALFDGYGLSRERPVRPVRRNRPVKMPRPMRSARPARESRIEGLGHAARPEEVIRQVRPEGLQDILEGRPHRNRGIGRY